MRRRRPDCLNQQPDYLCLPVDLVSRLLPILGHHISRMTGLYAEAYNGVRGAAMIARSMG